ncbi:short chain dehydrogenase [compost metagenome]
MQSVIRTSSKETFSEVERFKEYKTSNQLYSPELVSQKLHRLLHGTETDKVIYSLRDIEL